MLRLRTPPRQKYYNQSAITPAPNPMDIGSVQSSVSLRGKKTPARRRGFTLMEMIVVVAVFSLLIVAATDIFFIVTRAQRKSSANQAVNRDLRFSLESIAREVNQGYIDYDYYVDNNLSLRVDNQVQPLTLLALRDPSRRAVRFQVRDVNNDGNLHLQVSRGEDNNWQDLLSVNIRLVTAKFYIVPATDPFAASGNAPNEQPRVTIVLSAQAQPNSALDAPLTFFLQTTIVTRTYQR